MLDSLISLLAPHSCLSCSRIGFLLCNICAGQLADARIDICIGCGKPSESGICDICAPQWPAERAVVFAERTDSLKSLIDEYKYAHKRSAYKELSGLLDGLLPYGSSALVVPIPTIPKHIRERGYDHMLLLARAVARRNRLRYTPLLRRRGETVQHGASKNERVEQAATAFIVTETLDPTMLYIILDDITTTGASLQAAARELRQAGAMYVWVVALARQPLDDQG